MAYIGNQPTIGQYRKLDDISGSFNGSLTAFTMQVGSTNVNAGSAFQLLISLGGVIQNPGTDFTVSGSTLTFTTAPTSGLDFFGILMGQPLNTATPGDSTVTGAKIVDGTITGAKLAAGFNYDSGLLFLDDTNDRVGIGTASPAVKLHVSGAGTQVIRFEETGSSVIGKVFVTTSKVGIAAQSNHALSFETNNDEKARIDSSGRLLVGTNTARTNFDFYGTAQTPQVQIEGTSNNATALSLTANSTTDSVSGQLRFAKSGADGIGNNGAVVNNEVLGRINFSGSTGTTFFGGAEIIGVCDGTPSTRVPTRLMFYTGGATTDPTARMSIASDGRTSIGGTTSNNGHWMTNTGTDTSVLRLRQTNNSAGVLSLYYVGASNLNANDRYLSCLPSDGAGGARCFINSNGGIQNYQSNDSNLCDEREKKNIVDLDSTWDCLKHWELKKFHYNEDADTDDRRYGVIAQQVAQYCPEVISEWTKIVGRDAVLDEDGNEVEPAVEEVLRMGVKEQQMMWMAIKALQEAQTRIETLEAEVAALKGA